MNQKAKIIIVDDHPIVRQGMAMLINREGDMHACCEASDTEQALATNRSCQHNLAIVDLSLAGSSGLELVKRLLYGFPDLRILMMSMHDETTYAEIALRAGAHGYLMKQAATDTMLQAIRQILKGETYVSDQVKARMPHKTGYGNPDQASPIKNLTTNEVEVLHLIGLGLGTSEIAGKLFRSVKTIESHRANIKKKLNLNSGSQLAHFAINLISSSRQ
ncbi:MAG: response regulator transcription factor [Gallionellaceae bacterium]|nr:response regulator transcription factor [Gallionellaceae bacterium]